MAHSAVRNVDKNFVVSEVACVKRDELELETLRSRAKSKLQREGAVLLSRTLSTPSTAPRPLATIKAIRTCGRSIASLVAILFWSSTIAGTEIFINCQTQTQLKLGSNGQ